MKKKAVIICRISDPKQEDGFSLEAQKKHGLAYCQKNGFEIMKVHQIVETGSKAEKRHKFGAIVREIESYTKAGSIPFHLVIEKPDRLARNYTDKERLESMVKKGLLEIHYYKDRRVVRQDATPSEIFTDDMMTGVSKYIAANIAREAKKGMLQKAETGWFPSKPPLGYKNVREGNLDKNGRRYSTIAVDEATKDAVLRIFELRAVHHLSLGGIQKQILEERLLPSHREKSFNKSTVEIILKNVFYSGHFHWQGQVYQGKHEVFVPKRWFQMVQEQIRIPAKRKLGGLFSNFLTCGIDSCGCTIVYDPKVKTLKRSGQQKTYHYYHCSDGRGVHKEKNKRQINISENRLWDEFSQAVERIHITESLAHDLSEALKKEHQKNIAAHKREMSKYKDAIKITEAEEDKVRQAFIDDVFDKEAYLKAIEKIRKERRGYESVLEEKQLALTEKFYETSNFIIELSKMAKSLWKSRSPQERIRFLKTILSNQVLDETSVRYDLKKPFSTLAEMKANGEWCARVDSNH